MKRSGRGRGNIPAEGYTDMMTQTHSIEQHFLFRSGRAGKIEQWRENGDGTITRLSDRLTLTSAQYAAFLKAPPLPIRFAYDTRTLQ